MSEASIADRGTEEKAISERVTRGLDKFAVLGDRIIVREPGVYMVPDSDGHGHYRVDTRDVAPSCNCPDRRGHAIGVCKSIICALIADAKLPTYRVQKASQGDVYELLESRAGVEEVIGWGNVSEVYWMKWALENPEWEEAA